MHLIHPSPGSLRRRALCSNGEEGYNLQPRENEHCKVFVVVNYRCNMFSPVFWRRQCVVMEVKRVVGALVKHVTYQLGTKKETIHLIMPCCITPPM